MDAVAMGKAGLQGWRAKLADTVAPAVAKRAGVGDDDVRAAIGGVFFLLSVFYVLKTVKALAGRG